MPVIVSVLVWLLCCLSIDLFTIFDPPVWYLQTFIKYQCILFAIVVRQKYVT